MPLAMRKNVIDQALAMAFPEGVYRSVMAEAALKMILCLTQSPETHGLIARRELVEKILKIIILCEDYQESSISLKYVTILLSCVQAYLPLCYVHVFFTGMHNVHVHGIARPNLGVYKNLSCAYRYSSNHFIATIAIIIFIFTCSLLYLCAA